MGKDRKPWDKRFANYKRVLPDPTGKLKRCCPWCLEGSKEIHPVKEERKRQNGDIIFFCEICRNASIEPVAKGFPDLEQGTLDIFIGPPIGEEDR